MTTLKKRLADLEHSERLHFDKMAAQAQREFCLPLPDGTAVDVPLKMWARIRELPSGSPESLALVEDFRNWVLAQHEKHAKHDQT